MEGEELLALFGPGGYLAVVGAAASFVISSILSDVDPKRYLTGRPFLFIRVALGSLLTTWYCKHLAEWAVSALISNRQLSILCRTACPLEACPRADRTSRGLGQSMRKRRPLRVSVNGWSELRYSKTFGRPCAPDPVTGGGRAISVLGQLSLQLSYG